MPHAHVLAFSPLSADQFDERGQRQAHDSGVRGQRVTTAEATFRVSEDLRVRALHGPGQIDRPPRHVIPRPAGIGVTRAARRVQRPASRAGDPIGHRGRRRDQPQPRCPVPEPRAAAFAGRAHVSEVSSTSALTASISSAPRSPRIAVNGVVSPSTGFAPRNQARAT